MLLDTAADVLTTSYDVIRLHGLHAVLATAACGTIAAAMKYLGLIMTNTFEGQGSLHLCYYFYYCLIGCVE
jgi:hypothetical protein